LISNIYGAMTGANPLGYIDAVFGSAATLLAAFATYKMRHKWLAPLPPVIFNGIIIGLELTFVFTGRFDALVFLSTAGWVALSELIICYLGGMPLIYIFSDNLGKELFGHHKNSGGN
jgi:uncharacterized membrane protein